MSSAEKARTTAYSLDIRWRIVWLRMSQQLTMEAIARELQVGTGTVYMILTRFELHNSIFKLHNSAGYSAKIMVYGMSKLPLHQADALSFVFHLDLQSDTTG